MIMRSACWAMVLTLCTVCAWGQSADSADPDAVADRMLADVMEQQARRSMNSPTEPTDAMIERAGILMRQAVQLDSNDPERWLLLAEAQDAADDRAGLIDTLKHYLRLEPEDDVAKLRLVDLLASGQQTVEKRLAYYERIVSGPASRHFGPALRSRVAVRAARLQWEQGRPDEHARLLARALSLDPTNKHAAAESLARIAADPDADPGDHAAALFTLFHADPVDLNTHIAIADTMMAYGLYERALDWYESAAALRKAGRQRASLGLIHSRAMALWGLGRVADGLAVLDPITQLPDEAPNDAAAADAADTAPADDWPPLDTLMLDSAMRCWPGADDQADVSFTRLSDRLQRDIEADPNRIDALVTLLWSQVICNREMDAADARLTQLAERADQPVAVADILRGWVATRRGEHDRARELLEPHAEADLRARLGLALALEGLGRTDQAAEQYRQTHHAGPGDLFGLLAADRLQRLGAMLEPLKDAARVGSPFDQVPDDLQMLATDALRVVQIKAEVADRRIDYGRPILVTLELRNVSDWMLSLGPDGSIPTRVTLSPGVHAVDAEAPGAPPLIVDMYRRLRMEPRSELVVETRLDSGQLGALLYALAWPRLHVSCLGVLDPQLRASGRFSAGALGSSFRLPTVVRRHTNTDEPTLERLIAQSAAADPAQAMRAHALLISIAEHLHEQDEPDQRARARRIVDHLNSRFAELPSRAQAWSLAFTQGKLPRDVVDMVGEANVPASIELFSPMRQAAAQVDDERVQLMLLATEADPNSPYLNAALRGTRNSQTVTAFAKACRTVLTDQSRHRAAAAAQRDRMEARRVPSDLPPLPAEEDAEDAGPLGPPAPPTTDTPLPADDAEPFSDDADDIGGLRLVE